VAKTKAANAEEIAIVVHVMIPFDRPRVEAELGGGALIVQTRWIMEHIPRMKLKWYWT